LIATFFDGEGTSVFTEAIELESVGNFKDDFKDETTMLEDGVVQDVISRLRAPEISWMRT
jgi:hypothetical protein